MERLAPYLAASDGHHKNALKLYHWNISLSGAMHESLQMFEVVLRNAMDVQLRQWNVGPHERAGEVRSQDWLLDPSPLLQRLVGSKDLERAKSRGRRAAGHRSLRHSDVLAQLSMGTWRFLLPDKDAGRQRLWEDALKFGFPHLERPASELTGSVASINEMRNRVAHSEPLLRGSSAREQYYNMRYVLGEIDPHVAEWFVSNQRVTAVLKLRPDFS